MNFLFRSSLRKKIDFLFLEPLKHFVDIPLPWDELALQLFEAENMYHSDVNCTKIPKVTASKEVVKTTQVSITKESKIKRSSRLCRSCESVDDFYFVRVDPEGNLVTDETIRVLHFFNMLYGVISCNFENASLSSFEEFAAFVQARKALIFCTDNYLSVNPHLENFFSAEEMENFKSNIDVRKRKSREIIQDYIDSSIGYSQISARVKPEVIRLFDESMFDLQGIITKSLEGKKFSSEEEAFKYVNELGFNELFPAALGQLEMVERVSRSWHEQEIFGQGVLGLHNVLVHAYIQSKDHGVVVVPWVIGLFLRIGMKMDALTNNPSMLVSGDVSEEIVETMDSLMKDNDFFTVPNAYQAAVSI